MGVERSKCYNKNGGEMNCNWNGQYRDQPVMVFEEVARIVVAGGADTFLDLVVENTTEYHPAWGGLKKNNKILGDFAMINQMSCTETEFMMTVYYHGTGTPVPGNVLDEFNFQFVDFDQGLSRDGGDAADGNIEVLTLKSNAFDGYQFLGSGQTRNSNCSSNNRCGLKTAFRNMG